LATTDELRLRARALHDQAIQAALEPDWQRAVETNRLILESSPDDLDARSRLGRALLELGRIDDARAAYEEVVKIEPNNLVANRGLARLKALGEVNRKPVQTKTRTHMRNFIEDMGRTGIVRLINTPSIAILARYSPGAEVQLHPSGELVAVHGSDKELLGFLEPKVGRRLLSFLRAGNQYQAALVSTDPQNAKVTIRETFQHPSMAGKVPFPGSHRPAETRPYIRGTFFRLGGGAEEDELAEEMEEESEGIKPATDEEEAAEVLEEATIDRIEVEDDEEDDTEEE
jgi:tetratricopeptide (TPR) repeat protein